MVVKVSKKYFIYNVNIILIFKVVCDCLKESLLSYISFIYNLYLIM